jgi:hypothetical protein
MTFGRMQVRPGMEVVGTGAQPVGRVAEVRLEDLLLSRPGRGGVYVPDEAIRAMLGDQVVLDIHPEEIDARGWPASQGEGTS